MQPKVGGKLHLRLNTDTSPIADKYREEISVSERKKSRRLLHYVQWHPATTPASKRAFWVLSLELEVTEIREKVTRQPQVTYKLAY